jgi:glyoxylase I family protein
MDLLGVHHVALRVTDLARAGAFYRDVLGLTELARHRSADGTDRSIWLALPGGAFLALERATSDSLAPPTAAPRVGYCVLALRIWREQRSQIEHELRRRGAAIVHQTSWTIYIEDPEGNRIGLSHHPNDMAAPPP